LFLPKISNRINFNFLDSFTSRNVTFKVFSNGFFRFFLKTIVLILTLVICFSCYKKEGGDTQNYESYIEFTDSFSPQDWENPVIRKQISGGDKDIGAFISKDVLEPKVRNISLIIEKFFNFFKSQKNEDIKNILTLSAYNSYNLRYADVTFDLKYSVRTASPKDININPFWVDFKMIFTDKSILGRIELTQNGDDYKISDFDEFFFNELKKYINE